jgi:plastocyanin
MQTDNDCKTAVCDGNGGIGSMDDDNDIEDDNKFCTTDTCSGGNPMHTPVATGTACMDGGGNVCSVLGECVECNTGMDCPSNVCQANACQAASCGDMTQNGDETDVDCGGSCGPCADGEMCAGDMDCISQVCSGTCQMPSCTDMVPNGGETDVDCGGPVCVKCGPNQTCNGPTDCVGGSCMMGMCAPTCIDMVQNNLETDVDCGGGTCADCIDGKKCLVNGDCTNNFCRPDTKLCATPSCTDMFQNGTETDVDCGGNACPDCMNGDGCLVNGDCTSGFCNPISDVCAAPTCTDMFKNGNETDVDCGGTCPNDCAVGQSCMGPGDCVSGICTNNTCVQVNGCDVTNTMNLTGIPSTTVTFSGASYNPKCIRVSQGTNVTFSGSFSFHPLLGAEIVNNMLIPAGSGPFVPVTNTGTMKTFAMSATGTFPYVCTSHWPSGMTGTVFVVP